MKGNIYTKTGDKLHTDLYDGTRVSKSSDRIEVLGNYDELISSLSLAKNEIDDEYIKKDIEDLQKILFVFQADIAVNDNNKEKLKSEDVKKIEDKIDNMQEKLGKKDSFILPGSNKKASYLHLSRAISRRAERSLVRLAGHSFVSEVHLQFANRISDFLFVYAYSQEDELIDPFK